MNASGKKKKKKKAKRNTSTKNKIFGEHSHTKCVTGKCYVVVVQNNVKEMYKTSVLLVQNYLFGANKTIDFLLF